MRHPDGQSFTAAAMDIVRIIAGRTKRPETAAGTLACFEHVRMEVILGRVLCTIKLIPNLLRFRLDRCASARLVIESGDFLCKDNEGTICPQAISIIYMAYPYSSAAIDIHSAETDIYMSIGTIT